jgi:hypothetical protein
MNTVLQHVLLTLLNEDYAAIDSITDKGSLLTPSNPHVSEVIAELRHLNEQNAQRLQAIIDDYGWPGVALVGGAGAQAAYRLVLHAFTLPDFQRVMLPLLERAALAGDASWWDVARLDDRIRVLEGRLQKYGTQFRWNEEGRQVPEPPVEDPENVDRMRAAIGLCSLQDEAALRNENLKKHSRSVSAEENERRRVEAESWARLLGWRN